MNMPFFPARKGALLATGMLLACQFSTFLPVRPLPATEPALAIKSRFDRLSPGA